MRPPHKAKRLTELTGDTGAQRMLARRPPHPLNDKSVRLTPDAKTRPARANAPALAGGAPVDGYVWAVDPATGDALVDFDGTASVLDGFLLLVKPEHLEVA